MAMPLRRRHDSEPAAPALTTSGAEHLSPGDFVRAAEREVVSWAWLFHLIDLEPELRERLAAYVVLRDVVTGLASPLSDDALVAARSSVQSLIASGDLICADSRKGQFVHDIAAQRPDFAASVLQALVGTLQPRTLHDVEAIVAAVLHARGISNRANPEAKTLDKLEKRWHELVETTLNDIKAFKVSAADALAVGRGRLDNAAAENEKKLTVIRELLVNTDRWIEQMKARSDAEVRTHTAALTAQVHEQTSELHANVSAAASELATRISDIENAARNRLDAMERAYLESTALKAPVTFWSEKSAEHAKTGRRLMIASVTGGFLALGSLGALAWYILPAGAIISIRGIGVFLAVSALVIWLLRVAVRLWMLQIHLEADARERVVMAKTYLSLLQEGLKTTEEERKIVIQALFKRSVTGLTRDEATPVSALEVVSKVVGGTK